MYIYAAVKLLAALFPRSAHSGALFAFAFLAMDSVSNLPPTGCGNLFNLFCSTCSESLKDLLPRWLVGLLSLMIMCSWADVLIGSFVHGLLASGVLLYCGRMSSVCLERTSYVCRQLWNACGLRFWRVFFYAWSGLCGFGCVAWAV